MPDPPPPPSLIALAGPTGSGKSELALALAERFSGEIVNCDSLQLYRCLDIGTAKLPEGQRRGIPHHLLDVLDPDQVFTAGDYVRLARPLLAAITARGSLPVIVGGTGFYLRALLEGLFEGPRGDPELRARLARKRHRLHRILQRLDPAAAVAIHANDTRKLIRAIEVCLLARRRLSEVQRERFALAGYRVVKIGLDPRREALYARLDQRCAAMFQQGMVDEVRRVLARGFPAESKALEAIGYKEALAVVEGRLSEEQALVLAQRNTRRYAKRQMTWFRREPGVHWLQGFGHQVETLGAAIALVASFLQDS